MIKQKIFRFIKVSKTLFWHKFGAYLRRFNIPPKKPKKTLDFRIHLTKHCNLNCKYCAAFSSIADEEYYSTSQLKNDIKRIYEREF